MSDVFTHSVGGVMSGVTWRSRGLSGVTVMQAFTAATLTCLTTLLWSVTQGNVTRKYRARQPREISL